MRDPQHLAFICLLLIGLMAGYHRWIERIAWENEFNEQVLEKQRAMFIQEKSHGWR